MSEVNPAELDLPTLVSLAGSAANQHLLRRLHEDGYAGVRTSHGYVIQNLIDAAPTVGELAARLGVTQQAASKSVVEMEGMGLVTRVPDPAGQPGAPGDPHRPWSGSARRRSGGPRRPRASGGDRDR